MIKNCLTHILVLIFLISSNCLYSQQYKFEHYGQTIGLNNPFINSIEQDEHGFLVIGTGEGLGVFDGDKIKMYNSVVSRSSRSLYQV